MSLPITITNAGLAELINASATGTAAITIAAIGLSANTITPDPTMTSLSGEIYRLTSISGSVVTPDTIHVVMQDASANAYSANAFALYLSDGTLFAIYGEATPIYTKTAASIGMLAIDVTFASALATSITFGNTNFVNPPASQTAMGVVQLATLVQAQAGTDGSDVLTPLTAKGAVLNWIGYTPANRAGDTFTGLITVQGTGLNAGLKLYDTDGGRDFRVLQKEGGYFAITDETAAAERLTINAEGQIYAGGLTDNLIWNAGNDGAGSGLDADLLDGQQGAYYANIVARLGYTPLNAASFTAAEVLALLLSVDGTGSNLNADLWRGQTPAELLGPYALTANQIGIDQTWQNMTASRASGTTYTNGENAPIQVLVVFPDTGGGSPTITVKVGTLTLINSLLYDTGAGTGTALPSFIVPAGATYSVTWLPAESYTEGAVQWNELR